MSRRACVALKVNDLASSLAFYVDDLGFQFVESQLDADLAVVLDPYEEPLLLAGPAAHDIGAHLAEPRIIHQVGTTLDFVQEDLDARIAILKANGFNNLTEEQTEEGDRKLTIKAPGNTTILFVQQRSPVKTLAIYTRGAEDAKAALTELDEADLDLTGPEGGWSIRQIMHHLAEVDAMHLLMITSALAQSGSAFVRNPYNLKDQDHWAETLVFKDRAIEPSLALLTAIRHHIVQLCQHIPDFWERYVLITFPGEEGEGGMVTVGAFLDGLNWHLSGHCAEIREIRRLHNR